MIANSRILARLFVNRMLSPSLRPFHAVEGKPPTIDENPIKIYFTYTKAATDDRIETYAREGESLL